MTTTNSRVIQILLSFGETDSSLFAVNAVSRLLRITIEQAERYAWALEKRGFVQKRFIVRDDRTPGPLLLKWELPS